MAAENTYGRCSTRFATANEKLVLAEIENKDGIYDALKAFLGKGA